MNPLAPLSSVDLVAEADSDSTITPGIAADLIALTKARLSSLVVITTFVGFCMASTGRPGWVLLVHTLIGTALVAASAAVLNQVIESSVDRLMERTRHRPLPAGRMKPGAAAIFGGLMAASGFSYLATAANLLTASLAAATLLIYLLAYTPLKRRTSICILVGAIAGAIPPVIGWAAARPQLGVGAWILFSILFFWQMPHFLAIAWMYRDEYAQAGFVMLRKNDVGGLFTARESLLYSIALALTTLLPSVFHLVNSAYLAGAIGLGSALICFAFQFLLRRTRRSARNLFLASILYLPLLLGLMVFTRV